MNVIRIGEMPIWSGDIENFILLHPNLNAYILYDYNDSDREDRIFHGTISFYDVIALRHSAEMYTMRFIDESFDAVVEVVKSDWVDSLKEMRPEYEDLWGLRHFAIFIKDQGLFEFAARDCEFSGPMPGKLTAEDIWILKG